MSLLTHIFQPLQWDNDYQPVREAGSLKRLPAAKKLEASSSQLILTL
jgi:hypothetical protein